MTLRLTLSLGVLAIGAASAAMAACSDDSSGDGAVGLGGGAAVGGNGGGTAMGGSDPGSLGGNQGSGGGTGTGDPAMMPADGYIQGGQDGAIWGAWYTFGGLDSVFTPAEGEEVPATGGQICFSGTVAQVIGGDFGTYYGAVVGFDLCGMPGDMENCEQWMPPEYCSWAPESKHTVTECGISLQTISFDITGTLPDTELRVQFKEQGREENAYLIVAGTGSFSGNVADATVAYDASAAELDPTVVEAVHFQVASKESGTTEFNFCISNLQIL